MVVHGLYHMSGTPAGDVTQVLFSILFLVMAQTMIFNGVMGGFAAHNTVNYCLTVYR